MCVYMCMIRMCTCNVQSMYVYTGWWHTYPSGKY